MSSPNPPSAGKPAAPAEKKARKLGDYELIGKLGQGAMGAVYLANKMSTGQKVAIKILPHEMARDAEFLERFRREARAAQKIKHENVVAAYDVGVADNYNYIALEYMDGPNLEIMVQKKGRFSEEEVLKAAHDIASALEAAEAQGIVHRDIKPANILMNSQGVSKLTDLGLASASKGDQRVTMAGFAVGTPFYISPEQARGDLDVDCRADIYSLGATLYHLATGTLPFPGNNPVLIMTKHLQEMPQAPHERQPAVSHRVSVLIWKMMQKDPKDRHQNATELKSDIELCQRGEMPLMKKMPPGIKATAKVPKKPSAEKAAAPATEAVAAGASKSSGEFLDSLVALPDKILPMMPEAMRWPAFAVCGTVCFLGVMWAIIKLLK